MDDQDDFSPNIENQHLLNTTSSSFSLSFPTSLSLPSLDFSLSDFLHHFLESQAHSSTWRRLAEKQLIKQKALHPSELQPGDTHTASLLSSYFVLLKAIIGGGIFTLPYAISKCGYILGFFIMIGTCLMTITSLHLLARCSQKVHPASFYAVAKLTMPKAVILIDWAISLGCLGTGIAYLMIIGSLLPQVMTQIGLNGIFLQKELWVTVAFGICSPICYAHRINAFKWTSLIADISIVFVVLIILLYSIPSSGLSLPAATETVHTTSATLSLETLRVLGIFVGVFACSVNLFPVVNELKQPTTRREDIVIITAQGTSFLFYIIVAFCGYSTFGDTVTSNVLMEYPATSLTNAARALVCFQLVLSYPLVCFPGRDSLMSLWHSLVMHYPTCYLSSHPLKTLPPTPLSSPTVTPVATPLSSPQHDHEGKSYSSLQTLSSPSPSALSSLSLKPLSVTQSEHIPFEFDEEKSSSSTSPPIAPTPTETREAHGVHRTSSLSAKTDEEEEANIQRRFFISTSFYLLTTYALAMTVNDLGSVQSVVGATSACMTGYILPGSCYLIMFKDDHTAPKWCRIAAIFLLTFGIFFGPTCLFCIFY